MKEEGRNNFKKLQKRKEKEKKKGERCRKEPKSQKHNNQPF